MPTIPIIERVKVSELRYKALKGKYCLSPFVMIQVDLTGKVRLCGCDAWMPRTVGDLTTHSLEEILSGWEARQVRRSIIDGTYLWCNEKTCGVLTNDDLLDYDATPDEVKPLLTDEKKFRMPNFISISGDLTCNLSCPSCRTGVIKPKPSDIKLQKNLWEIISQNLLAGHIQDPVTIHISTSGEIFASKVLLGFLQSIDLAKIPNLRLQLQTNGIMAPKTWHHIQHLESAIDFIIVSIDAAQASTYEVIRRGGTWKRLLTAMEFLRHKKLQCGFDLRTKMVVQDRNWREISDFYDFSRCYDVDQIEYTPITDWASWTPQEFQTHNVFDPNHQHFQSVQHEISKIKHLAGVWCHGMRV